MLTGSLFSPSRSRQVLLGVGGLVGAALIVLHAMQASEVNSVHREASASPSPPFIAPFHRPIFSLLDRVAVPPFPHSTALFSLVFCLSGQAAFIPHACLPCVPPLSPPFPSLVIPPLPSLARASQLLHGSNPQARLHAAEQEIESVTLSLVHAKGALKTAREKLEAENTRAESAKAEV